MALIKLKRKAVIQYAKYMVLLIHLSGTTSVYTKKLYKNLINLIFLLIIFSPSLFLSKNMYHTISMRPITCYKDICNKVFLRWKR